MVGITSSATAAVVRIQHVTYILVTGGNCKAKHIRVRTYWLPNSRIQAGAHELFVVLYQSKLTCLYQSSMACNDTDCLDLEIIILNASD